MNSTSLDQPSRSPIHTNPSAEARNLEYTQEQIDTEISSLRAQMDSLKDEGHQIMTPLYESPITRVIESIPEDQTEAYDYTELYKFNYGTLLTAIYSLPDAYTEKEDLSLEQLYEDMKEMFPHLRLQATASFATQVDDYIAGISPKKRERIGLHPEQWNYAVLAKKYRLQFLDASKKPILLSNPDAADTCMKNFEDLTSSLQMTAIFTLMSQDPTVTLSEDTFDRQRKFLDQTLEPIHASKIKPAYDDGSLLKTLMASYRQAFISNPVEFSAIQKLNEIAGDKAHQYLEYLLIESVLQNVSSQFSDVRDIATMQDSHIKVFKTIYEEGGKEFATATEAAIEMHDKQIWPAYYKAEKQIDILEHLTPPSSLSERVLEKLDWEVLPPGDLEKIAREIVQSAHSEKHTPTIDLERLTVLENIRTRWGEEDCYYARGALSTRRIIRDGTQTEADQYLMLILQERAEDGSVTAEHAIAESPIAGPNALYVFRQDVSENLNWRDVMSLPKTYARDFGARIVKHTLPRGETDLVGVMTEKVSALMIATPEEFKAMQFNGAQGLRIPRSLLRFALQSE